jgi:hypothetical protein
MTQPPRQLLSLWDYGWLDHNEFLLPPCSNSQEVVATYLRSDSFGTSFVGPSLDQAEDLHGPFRRELIAPTDFQLVSPGEFHDQVQSIRHPEGFSEPASDEQWRAVELLISELEKRYRWILRLGLTDDNAEKFHDWGYVLNIFQEFLLANPNSEPVSRLVFGYD